MTIYKNGKEIEEFYIGGQEIAEIYHGSDLIFENEKYDPGQVLFTDTNPGEHSFSVLTTGFYKIGVVGAGGAKKEYAGPNFSVFAAGGGSGSAIEFIAYLRKNTSYSYVVGAYASNNSKFNGFTAYGGESGRTDHCGSGGATPTLSVSEIETPIVKRTYESAGNPGAFCTYCTSQRGGASVYNGIGSGGGGNGGLRVEYVGRRFAQNYSYILNINVPANIYIENELVASDETSYTGSISFPNQQVHYRVEAVGYDSKQDVISFVSGKEVSTVNVVLDALNYSFTINSNVESSITINGVTTIGDTASAQVNYGTIVNWEVSAEGYISQNGTETITEDKTLSITLEEA